MTFEKFNLSISELSNVMGGDDYPTKEKWGENEFCDVLHDKDDDGYTPGDCITIIDCTDIDTCGE